VSSVFRNLFGMVFFLEQRCKDRPLKTKFIREILNVQYAFFLSKPRGSTNIAAAYKGSVLNCYKCMLKSLHIAAMSTC